MDNEVFGDDADQFRPERWLDDGDDQHKKAMARAFLAFSAGKRLCMGIHIAWLEVKKTIPVIVSNFDVCTLIYFFLRKSVHANLNILQFELVNPDQKAEEEARISAVKYAPPIWMWLRKRD